MGGKVKSLLLTVSRLVSLMLHTLSTESITSQLNDLSMKDMFIWSRGCDLISWLICSMLRWSGPSSKSLSSPQPGHTGPQGPLYLSARQCCLLLIVTLCSEAETASSKALDNRDPRAVLALIGRMPSNFLILALLTQPLLTSLSK